MGTVSQNDIIGVLLNADDGKCVFQKNGVTIGSSSGYAFNAAVSSGYLFCKLLTFSVGLTSGKVCATSHC